jgi:phage shock protein A
MFKRIGNLVRGFFALFVSGVERRNPEALLEIEKENMRVQIARYNQGLASHAGLCESLMAQVRKLEADERDLHAKTSANLRVGNPPRRTGMQLLAKSGSRPFWLREHHSLKTGRLPSLVKLSPSLRSK